MTRRKPDARSVSVPGARQGGSDQQSRGRGDSGGLPGMIAHIFVGCGKRAARSVQCGASFVGDVALYFPELVANR